MVPPSLLSPLGPESTPSTRPCAVMEEPQVWSPWSMSRSGLCSSTPGGFRGFPSLYLQSTPLGGSSPARFRDAGDEAWRDCASSGLDPESEYPGSNSRPCPQHPQFSTPLCISGFPSSGTSGPARTPLPGCPLVLLTPSSADVYQGQLTAGRP